MDVEVVQPGNHRAIADVHDPRVRSGELPDIAASPDHDHASARDADRLGGLQAVGLGRDDHLAADHQIRAWSAHGRTGVAAWHVTMPEAATCAVSG